MFGKPDKKAIIKMNYEHGGSGGSSTSIPLKDGELLDYLKRKLDFHKELVITNIIENEIYLTTSRTVEYQEIESRADEIGDLVRNYVKSKAIEMDAYAVLAKGELKGIFGREVNSRLKRVNLINRGFKEEEIEIKLIKIESFEDLS